MKLDSYPHPSRRSAVLAPSGVVATSQPLAAQAGLAVLRQGGNAVDAIIATAAALTVVEPTSNGIGSDAFALVWDGSKLHGLNASGRSPAALELDQLAARGGGAMPQRGWSSVTVPGAPDAWGELHKKFGRLEFPRLLESAIHYATDGFPVSPVIAELWRRAGESFMPMPGAEFDGWRSTFSLEGRTPSAGQIWRSPGHAAALKLMAAHGVRDFYEGEIARGLLEFSARTGGLFNGADLAAHRSEWVDPICMSYAGHEIWEIPPNGQGIAALMALGIVSNTDMGKAAHSSVASWHLQIEAMKLAFADAYRYVADPEHRAVPTRGMLDSDYLAGRAAKISENAAVPDAGRPPGGGTVYLCAADRDGMMVSFIQSNYMGFGSGVVAPEYGVSFQNRGAAFVLDPDHPNVTGPGKRPRHTIIPAFITRGSEAVGPFGVMGGEMQPQGHLQVVSSMLDHGFNPQSALDAPRWQLGEGKTVLFEAGTDPDLIEGLRARGHEMQLADSFSFGRGQIIVRHEGGAYAAGTEPRTDGVVAGY